MGLALEKHPQSGCNYESIMRLPITVLVFLLPGFVLLPAQAEELTSEQTEFFEKKIRPVLAENCYECHNSVNKAKGDLVLDYKDGFLDGGETGPALIPGKPKKSLLLQVLRHEIQDLKMPKGGPKVMPEVLSDFEKINQRISEFIYRFN